MRFGRGGRRTKGLMLDVGFEEAVLLFGGRIPFRVQSERSYWVVIVVAPFSLWGVFLVNYDTTC